MEQQAKQENTAQGRRNKNSVWAEIEPYCVLQMIARNLWMVLMAAGLAALAAYLVMTLLVKPKYTCTAAFAVTARANSTSASTGITQSSAEQFASLLTDSTLLDTVREEQHLGGAVTVSSSVIKDTNMIELSVTAASPKVAYAMADGIIRHYSDYAQYVFTSVVLKPVRSPNVPSASGLAARKRTVMIIAAPIGAVAMSALLAVLSILSGTVQTTTGAKNQIDGTMIASLGHVRKRHTLRMLLRGRKSSLLISNPATGFGYVETLHQASARLEHEKRRRGHKVFLVTSVSENEGKSTVAANLALSLAKKHKKVLLADCDLRKPAQQLIFEQKPDPECTLSSLLQGKLEPEALTRALQYRKNDNLFCLYASPLRRRKADLFGSARMQQLVAILRQNFDYVILDSPPLGYFSDSEQLADLADASLIVVRQDGVTALAVNDAIDALTRCHAHFLGYVLNDMRRLHISSRAYGYGYGYGYGHGYGYGYGYGKRGTSDKDLVRAESLQKTEVQHGE